MNHRLSRRELLNRGGRQALGLGLGLAGASARAAGQASPNSRVVLGLIGAGGMGVANMHALMDKPEVQVAAICDVDSSHLAGPAADVEKKYGRAPSLYKDFRRLLERKDIDGVIIGTPDHWHALPCITACEAGKDVYCEKPISHDIVEGQAMVRAARKFKRVIQVGTWQRSTQHFVDAIDYVRSGRLGKISVCRAWTLGHAGQGRSKPETPPASVDYDFWVGPAAWEPYQPNRFHGSFRWFFNYAAGLAGDWGVHMIDIVLLGMSQDQNLAMPRTIQSVGGKIVCGPDDDRTTPDTQITTYQFNKPDGTPDWVMNWEMHVGGPGLDGGGSHGSEFIGAKGRLLVDRDGWSVWDKDGKPMEQIPSQNRVNDHWQNWLDCVKSRGTPRSDIASMYQTTTVCHLANAAYLAGERLVWDDAKQTIANSRRALSCQSYERAYRKPWTLPLHWS